MTTTDRDDPFLEDLLAEARGLRPVPSPELMARILADAEAARPAPTPAAAPPVPRRPGRLAALAAALGGWPALGGLVASVILGVGLGVAQPAGLSGLAAAVWGDRVSVSLGIDQDPLSLLEG